MFPVAFASRFVPDICLRRRPSFFKHSTLLFILILVQAEGSPTDGRRRLYQTSASPIPHPDITSLKKSETTKGSREEFFVYNLRGTTRGATPQIPMEESGVKKSSTAQRPVERKRSGMIIDSIESILNLKTHSNAEETGIASKERYLVSRVLHDQGREKATLISKNIVVPTYNYEAQIFRRAHTPRATIPRVSVDKDNGDAPGVKTLRAPIFHHRRPNDTGGDSLVSEVQELFRREKISGNPIPRPPPEDDVRDSLGNKRNLVFPDDTSKILERKTLLYSEPTYKPTGGERVRQEPIDPRRLISILGDPAPFKRGNVAKNTYTSQVRKKMHVKLRPWGHMHRRGRARRAHHRKARFKHHRKSAPLKYDNWDQTEQSHYKDTDGGFAVRKAPNEHLMLENLLDDYSMSFGTRDEKLEKEATIKEIEELNLQNSVLSKDDDLFRLQDDMSNMEVTEGNLPSYDKIPGTPDEGISIRRSHISRKKGGKRGEDLKAVYNETPDVGRARTGTSHFTTRSRLRKKAKRSLGYYHHHWRPSYLHVRSHHFSPYYDFTDEPEPIEPIPRITNFMDFPRFPTATRLPEFPMSLMAVRFVPYPRLPSIEENFPPPLEKLERLPEPPPIPQAILDREETGTREPEPESEGAPLPEPVPAPEPPPIAEPPPIPELAPIKEIPPIAEPPPKTPPNLDPKKTFGTGESNGGVKKST